MSKNKWFFLGALRFSLAIGALLIPCHAHAWWSAPLLASSTHHKITDGARAAMLSLPEQWPDVVAKYGVNLSDWTSGAVDDARAHANASERNDGPISRWWEYALQQYKLFRFSGSGDPLSSQKPGAYYYIALMAHLTEDMGVPAHAYNIPHGWFGAMDNMEQVADSNWSNASPAISLVDSGKNVTTNYSDLKDLVIDSLTADSAWRAYYNNDGSCGDWYGEPENPLKKGYYSGGCGAEDSFHSTWLMSHEDDRIAISQLLGAAGGYAGGALMAMSRSLPPLGQGLRDIPSK